MQYSRFFNQLCVAAYESDDGREHVAQRSPSEIDGWMDDGFAGVENSVVNELLLRILILENESDDLVDERRPGSPAVEAG